MRAAPWNALLAMETGSHDKRPAYLEGSWSSLEDELLAARGELSAEAYEVRWTRANRIAAVTLVTSLALALWALFFPYPFTWVMSANVALPWVALALVAAFRSDLAIIRRRHDPRPMLGGLSVLLAGYGLCMRALDDIPKRSG
jgi:hypothetical protein